VPAERRRRADRLAEERFLGKLPERAEAAA